MLLLIATATSATLSAYPAANYSALLTLLTADPAGTCFSPPQGAYSLLFFSPDSCVSATAVDSATAVCYNLCCVYYSDRYC